MAELEKSTVCFLPVSHPLQLAMGLIIWSLWFVLIYAGLSVACSFTPPAAELQVTSWINALLLAVTILTTTLLGHCAYRCWRVPEAPGNRQFVARVATGVYLVASGATLAIGLPISVLPPCI